MTGESNRDLIRQQIVEATIHMYAGDAPTHQVRTGLLIQLREGLRDLCVASGSWSSALEAAYQADIAALRKLGGMPSPQVP